jgi:hypothetical protein
MECCNFRSVSTGAKKLPLPGAGGAASPGGFTDVEHCQISEAMQGKICRHLTTCVQTVTSTHVHTVEIHISDARRERRGRKEGKPVYIIYSSINICRRERGLLNSRVLIAVMKNSWSQHSLSLFPVRGMEPADTMETGGAGET